MSNIGRKLRLAAVGRASAILLPGGTSADRTAQRHKIAEFVRTLIDGSYDRMVVIEMLIGGLAFLGDNLGVSRKQMADALIEVAVSPDRQLIYSPTD